MSQALEMGIRIKSQRELLGLTREELAEQLDITPRFCYDLELGQKGMSVSTLCKLCNTLNVSSDYLLFGESEDDKWLAEGTALLQSCPVHKREYLNHIISKYIQAVSTP